MLVRIVRGMPLDCWALSRRHRSLGLNSETSCTLVLWFRCGRQITLHWRVPTCCLEDSRERLEPFRRIVLSVDREY